MAWYGWVLIVLAALAALYLYLIAPSRRHPDASALLGWLYAHRGLHDEKAPENSMQAFRLAVEHGYGIELDVQLTRDGQMVVHHDSNTRRVCGVDAEILQTDYADLPTLPDGSHLPLFTEVLAMVAGRSPLIVEVKQYGSPSRNAAEALRYLRAYQGPFCVESFHPVAVRYFRQNAPEIERGQLSMGGKRDATLNPVAHFALHHLLVNVLGRPHFVAYQAITDGNLSMWLMKRAYRPLLAAWTIRDQALLERVRKQYDMPIFERFIPTQE